MKKNNWLRFKILKIFIRIRYNGNADFGDNCTYRKGFSVIVKKNANLLVGNNVFFNRNCSINCLDKIVIGDDCLFGEGVKIYDHNHIFYHKPIRKQGYKKAAVLVGNNCWIGSNVVILSGVTIGDNSVIGAGCVITKDVPEGSLVKNNQVLSVENINWRE